jgi:EmrB/QacA subfamily drug resistance transporter
MGSSINIALPSVSREFSINAVVLGWIATSYILAAAMFLVPFGRIADIHGRKKIFTCGISLYTLASLFSAFSTTAFALIVFRILQGIGSAMIFGTSVAILTSAFPVGERGKALGINTAATYLGLSFGPILGGFLTQYFGWRSLFLFNIPICLIVIVLIFWRLKGEWAEARGEKFDWAGSIIYGLTLVAVMYGLSLLPNLAGAGLIFIGFIGIIAFSVRENRTESPILNIHLLRHNRVFGFSNLAALINYSATQASGFLLSLYLQYLKGLPPQSAGLILVAQPVMMTIFSPLAGRLSDKVEPRVVASTGMALTSASLFFFIFLNKNSGLGFIVGCLIVLGLGFALFSSPNTNAVMSSVEKKFYGVASATLGTMRLVGQMTSMGIAMMLFALYIGRVKITPEYYALFLKSSKTAFIIFAVLCAGGVFASLARGRNQNLE